MGGGLVTGGLVERVVSILEKLKVNPWKVPPRFVVNFLEEEAEGDS